MDALQGFSAETTGFCELHGYKLYYELVGHETAGGLQQEKIILIEGAFCTRKVFAGIAPKLASCCHVLVFDNRGVGLSSAPKRWKHPTR